MQTIPARLENSLPEWSAQMSEIVESDVAKACEELARMSESDTGA